MTTTAKTMYFSHFIVETTVNAEIRHKKRNDPTAKYAELIEKD